MDKDYKEAVIFLLEVTTKLGDVVDANRAAEMLKRLKVPDPLKNPPDFLDNHLTFEEKKGYRSGEPMTFINLGQVNGWDVTIEHFRVRTVFHAGCRRKATYEAAKRHWEGGRSQYSGDARPHFPELIEWVKKVCDHKGWKW